MVATNLAFRRVLLQRCSAAIPAPNMENFSTEYFVQAFSYFHSNLQSACFPPLSVRFIPVSTVLAQFGMIYLQLTPLHLALIFPNVGFTLATVFIGQQLESNAIQWVSTIMIIVLVVVWLLQLFNMESRFRLPISRSNKGAVLESGLSTVSIKTKTTIFGEVTVDHSSVGNLYMSLMLPLYIIR